MYSTVSTRQLLFVWRSLSDDCQMPHQTSVNSNHLHQTPYIWLISGGWLVYVWWTYGTECLVGVWQIVYIWYISDRCLVGVDRCLLGHLTGIWQSYGDHLTASTRQIANVTVCRKRWWIPGIDSNRLIPVDKNNNHNSGSDHRHHTGRPCTYIRRIRTQLAVWQAGSLKCPSSVTGDNPVNKSWVKSPEPMTRRGIGAPARMTY